MHPAVNAVYAASAQDLYYALGVLDLPNRGALPIVQIFYPTSNRELRAI